MGANTGPNAWSTYAELLVVARALESDELANRVRLAVADVLESCTIHEIAASMHATAVFGAQTRSQLDKLIAKI